VRIVKGFAGLLLGVLLAGCASAPPRAVLPPPAVLPAVAAAALTQLGVPYRLGGADPAGFDCSGLVQWAFAVAGTKVPRTTEEQFGWFKAVPRDELQPGDLVFFRLRSEEHTSELQSHHDLVCRLLLEKKKKT